MSCLRTSRRPSIANNAGGVAHTLWAPPPAPTPDSPEIVLVRSYAMDDGRYINNGWLQELPDPITKLTWDNAALMSPVLRETSRRHEGDLVNIAITEKGLDAQKKNIRRELVIAALISPGHADNSITIPLGYGRKADRTGRRRSGLQRLPPAQQLEPAFHLADGQASKRSKSRKWPGRTRCRSRRITGASKAAVSCAKRRSSIIAKITNS